MIFIYWLIAHRKIKSLEFRVMLIGLATTVFMILMFSYIDRSIQSLFILFIIMGISLMVFNGWYISKTIRSKTRQLKNLVDNVIKASVSLEGKNLAAINLELNTDDPSNVKIVNIDIERANDVSNEDIEELNRRFAASRRL